jgi:hypothetical protein
MLSGIFLIAIGLFTMAMTFIKPDIYWNGSRMLRMRRMFGDAIANIIYIVIAIILVFYGASMLN